MSKTMVATFGVQYGPWDEHPHLPGVTGKHYVEVIVPDGEPSEEERMARSIIHGLTGGKFAFLYDDDADIAEIKQKWAPAGRFMRVEVTRG